MRHDSSNLSKPPANESGAVGPTRRADDAREVLWTVCHDLRQSARRHAPLHARAPRARAARRGSGRRRMGRRDVADSIRVAVAAAGLMKDVLGAERDESRQPSGADLPGMMDFDEALDDALAVNGEALSRAGCSVVVTRDPGLERYPWPLESVLGRARPFEPASKRRSPRPRIHGQNSPLARAGLVPLEILRRRPRPSRYERGLRTKAVSRAGGRRQPARARPLDHSPHGGRAGRRHSDARRARLGSRVRHSPAHGWLGAARAPARGSITRRARARRRRSSAPACMAVGS